MMTQFVHWHDPQKLPAPRQAQPNRRETKYRVECHVCGLERWLAKCDAERAERTGGCQHCASIVRGKKGAKSTLAKYGKKFLLEQVAKHQLAHPSKPERMIAEFLEARNVVHNRQFIYMTSNGDYVIDFLLPGKAIAIECDSIYWHQQRLEHDENLKRDFFGIVISLDAEQIVKDATYIERELSVIF